MPDPYDPEATPRVALIGFGEAGEKFARAGQWHGRACGWDLLPARRAVMAELGVSTGPDARSALGAVDLTLALVTADQALAAAREYAALLPAGTLWLDMNSVSPDTKRAAAEAVEASGGRYVDAAVMAPVDSELTVPVLLAGQHAEAAATALGALGFGNVRTVGAEVGRAAAIKMIRSVLVKGIEALSYECAAAAEAAGVTDEVLASLDASDKRRTWADQFAYNRGRMEQHGARRAVEMEESAKTLQGLGIEPVMTRGTVEVQRRAAKPKKDAA
jgi:3-hydroxyisobutyrate dehydrogenase-like beta-hydroxyacid dehydrogenase